MFVNMRILWFSLAVTLSVFAQSQRPALTFATYIGSVSQSSHIAVGLPGEPAGILFAGQAPGLVAGAVQLNLRVPDDAAAGAGTLGVYVGNFPAPGGRIWIGAPAIGTYCASRLPACS